MIESPLFVVGAERSGTTLFRLMLDHHPQIAFPHQLEFVVDCVGDDASLPDLPSYWAYLETSGIFQRSGFSVDRDLGYFELVNDFLEQRRGGCPIVGGTVHRHLERLVHLWPEARFIHVVRDPRAVAQSVLRMGWAGNAWAAVTNWIEVEEAWTRLSARLPESRRCELRYEKLVENSAGELQRICAFLGVPADDAMLSYPEETTYERPTPAHAKRWQSELRPLEQRRVDARLGELLEQRGYAPCGFPSISIGPLHSVWLPIGDRVGRARFRWERYGGILYMADVLSRALGTAVWRRRTAERIRVVNAGYIK